MKVRVIRRDGNAEVFENVSDVQMDMDLDGALLLKEVVKHTVTPEEAAESRDAALKRRPLPAHGVAPRIYTVGEVVDVEVTMAIFAPKKWWTFRVLER